MLSGSDLRSLVGAAFPFAIVALAATGAQPASQRRAGAVAMLVAPSVCVVVVLGTIWGSLLPLIFRRLGMDPALMSNPLIAAFMDLMGVVFYNSIALAILGAVAT